MTDTPKKGYLRDRPFLLVQFSSVPYSTRGLNRIRTESKGWMRRLGSLTTEELPLIVDRVSDKHLVNYPIIIDITEQKVIKNGMRDTYTDDEVINHFCQKYRSTITDGILEWMKRRNNTKKEGC